jgi:hypothetical protein
MTKQAFCCSTDQGGGKRRGDNLALRLRHAFPSAVRSYQALTFYPALAYGVDNNRIGSANFVGVNNRGLSGIVYRIKVACGRGKQSRHSAWDGRFGKIADPKFHARKIKRQRPTSNNKSSAGNFKLSSRQDGLFEQTTAKPPAMSTNRRLCLGVELIRGKATPSPGETMPVRTERHTLRRRGPFEAQPACFVVRGYNGQALAYVYFEDEPGRRY